MMPRPEDAAEEVVGAERVDPRAERERHDGREQDVGGPGQRRALPAVGGAEPAAEDALPAEREDDPHRGRRAGQHVGELAVQDRERDQPDAVGAPEPGRQRGQRAGVGLASAPTWCCPNPIAVAYPDSTYTRPIRTTANISARGTVAPRVARLLAERAGRLEADEHEDAPQHAEADAADSVERVSGIERRDRVAARAALGDDRREQAEQDADLQRQEDQRGLGRAADAARADEPDDRHDRPR